MSDVVIDASALGALLLPDEGGTAAQLASRHLESSAVVAPRHFPIEILSLIIKAYRRKRIDATQRDRIVDLAQRLTAKVRIDEEMPLTGVAILVERHGLSAYDAAYLELTVRTGGRLISCDGKLSRAAAALGVAAA